MTEECAICRNNKEFQMPEALISAAIEGNLVLFCGAGISTENKMVLPYSFYDSIKKELEIEDDAHSFSQLMEKYCKKPDGRKKLLNRIRERFQYINSFPELERQATAFHRELADIYQIRTIITTNWDTYFEEYCGATPITIPEDFSFWDDNSRFVLKIHGSINNLSTIVATTKDYRKSYNALQKAC
ncbi:MAG: SIR2 family protein [Lachnospiraceae bacterium]|nr:SIR2 family protein [Lachnospiraceae bacterium]